VRPFFCFEFGGKETVIMGSIYKRRGSLFYQYQFTPPGASKPIRGSTKETNKKKALEYLMELETDAGRGVKTYLYAKTGFDDLKRLVKRRYKEKGNKTMKKAERNLKRLEEFFGDMRVIDIDEDKILDFKEQRLKTGIRRTSLNRELATLRLGLRLLKRYDKIPTVPHVEMYSEKHNARQRYLTLEEYNRFVASLYKIAPYLAGPVELAVRTGWRKSTIFNIKWEHVDREECEIRAPYLLTKNKEPVWYPYGEDPVIRSIIEVQWANRDDSVAYVFPNRDGTDRIRDMRHAWNKAVEEAKIGDGKGYDAGYEGGTKWHDLKRTAFVLNEEAGISRSVTMSMSGTKSGSIFERYNIVDKHRIRSAIRKRQSFMQSKGDKSEPEEDVPEGWLAKSK
jgi:site-specific recombinase XerC